MKRVRDISRYLSLCGVVLLTACGSAAEFSGDYTFDESPVSGKSGSQSQVIAQYNVFVDPIATEIQISPQSVATNLTKVFALFPSLAQIIPSSDIVLSNASTTTFDEGALALRLPNFCLQNVTNPNKYLSGVSMNLTQFSSSTVTADEGGVSNGQGTYAIDFDEIPPFISHCRSLALSNSSSITYRFVLNLTGTYLNSYTIPGHIQSLSPPRFLVGKPLNIFGYFSSPTDVYIGGNKVPTGLIDYPSVSTIRVTPDASMADWNGIVSVQDGANLLPGPYTEGKTALDISILLKGSTNRAATAYYRTWSGTETPDSNGCLSATLDDAEHSNSVNLGPSYSWTSMNYLSTPGSVKNFYMAFDYNNNHVIDSGDYYVFIPSVDVNRANTNLLRRSRTVAVGKEHGCVILETTGGVRCWGNDGSGILGDGPGNSTSNVPVDVAHLTSGVTAISSYYFHTCAIQNGAAYCWGANGTGGIGDGTTTDAYSPTAVSGLSSDVSMISTGDSFSCAIWQGSAQCWGSNNSGQLGDGSQVDSSTPVAVKELNKLGTVSAISTGSNHSCAIQNGGLYCWGGNDYGQLGTGDTKSSNTPMAVKKMESGVTAVSAGNAYTCAIQNGALYCWGYNQQGELGDGTTKDRTEPTAVTGAGYNVSQISAGNTHTCAVIDTEGYCWGRNPNGQLGDGTTVDQLVPEKILPDTTSIATGVGEGGCAISSSKLDCWGDNSFGQIGDGTNNPSLIPVEVSGSQPIFSSSFAVSNTISATCP